MEQPSKMLKEEKDVELKDESGELRVRCLLKEYKESAECFRHTYTTIWQSGIMFATFSVAIFGFYFSFQNQVHISLPYLPFISLSSIVLWWLMVFEPMNHYGDVRAKRCEEIESELSKIVPNLKMKHFSSYGEAKGKILRVRSGVRVLAIIIIVLMILLVIVFGFPSAPSVDP